MLNMQNFLSITEYSLNAIISYLQEEVIEELREAFPEKIPDVKMLAGEHVVINTARFQNDMTTFESKDDVLTLLIHLGYLAFDWGESAVFIPNAEIRGEFRNAIVGERWKNVADSGVAISPEQRQTIFGPFQCSDESRVAKDGRVYQGICY